MAEIDSKRKQERAERIERRAKNYINGDISLDTFIMLEQLDNEDEADIVEALEKEREKKEAEAERAERRKEADKLRELLAHDEDKADEAETEQEPKQAAPKQAAPYPPELDDMTAAEYRKLGLAEMNRLYEAAPDKVREILDSDKPAYMKLLYPNEKPRDYTATTAEEFKSMNLAELSRLYEAAPDLYMKLRDESRGGGA